MARGQDIDVETAICHAVDELYFGTPFPGERDIRDTERELRDRLIARLRCRTREPHEYLKFCLFARLSSRLTPDFLRNIAISALVATNVAEASLTVGSAT